MSTNPVILRGTVKPDGTLELLDSKVPLPAGHVQVTVQPEPPPPGEDWWDYLRRCRAELAAAGAIFRRGVDIAAEIEQVRGESERAEAVYWEMEWQKHHGGAAC